MTPVCGCLGSTRNPLRRRQRAGDLHGVAVAPPPSRSREAVHQESRIFVDLEAEEGGAAEVVLLLPLVLPGFQMALVQI